MKEILALLLAGACVAGRLASQEDHSLRQPLPPAPGESPAGQQAPPPLPPGQLPPHNGATPPAAKEASPKKARSFLVWLAQVSGLSSAPSGLRGGEDDHQGDVWEEAITGGPARRLTLEGGYSWPVYSADDRHVVAMRGGELWSIPAAGGRAVQLLHAPADMVSLVGSGPDGLLILTTDLIGTFSPETGAFSPFQPTSREERDEIVRLHSPVRAYDQGQLVVSERNGVLVVVSGGVRHVHRWEGDDSWQPSASHDLARLVFIRPHASP